MVFSLPFPLLSAVITLNCPIALEHVRGRQYSAVAVDIMKFFLGLSLLSALPLKDETLMTQALLLNKKEMLDVVLDLIRLLAVEEYVIYWGWRMAGQFKSVIPKSQLTFVGDEYNSIHSLSPPTALLGYGIAVVANAAALYACGIPTLPSLVIFVSVRILETHGYLWTKIIIVELITPLHRSPTLLLMLVYVMLFLNPAILSIQLVFFVFCVITLMITILDCRRLPDVKAMCALAICLILFPDRVRWAFEK